MWKLRLMVDQRTDETGEAQLNKQIQTNREREMIAKLNRVLLTDEHKWLMISGFQFFFKAQWTLNHWVQIMKLKWYLAIWGRIIQAQWNIKPTGERKIIEDQVMFNHLMQICAAQLNLNHHGKDMEAQVIFNHLVWIMEAQLNLTNWGRSKLKWYLTIWCWACSSVEYKSSGED